MSALGRGIYTYGEAARLLGVSHARVRGWFEGWPGRGPTVVQSDYAADGESTVVSFLDLVDAMVATQLRKYNVSMANVKKAYGLLGQHLGVQSHPFARRELLADDCGRLFVSIAEESEERDLIDLFSNQRVFPKIMLPFLRRVEYADALWATRVRLDQGIVIDPTRKYGVPIVQSVNLPVAILARAVAANNRDVELVAELYDVSVEDVTRAVRFHETFRGLAA